MHNYTVRSTGIMPYRVRIKTSLMQELITLPEHAVPFSSYSTLLHINCYINAITSTSVDNLMTPYTCNTTQNKRALKLQLTRLK